MLHRPRCSRSSTSRCAMARSARSRASHSTWARVRSSRCSARTARERRRRRKRYPACSGRINFLGQRIDGVPAHELIRLGICHVPEGRHVFPRMTVAENLEMGAFRFKKIDQADLDRVLELFPRLQERYRQISGTLSGGEQQMLAIGRALMGKPRLLLLDEPSMGLAPMVVAQIFTIVREINESGVTVLLVEQNAAQALALADRGYVLETGELVLQGTGAELLADDRVRAAYLGEEIAAS